MQTSEERLKHWVQLLLGVALTLLFFYMMAPFLVALFLGAVIALITFPVYQRLTRLLPRALSSLVVTLMVTLGILFPIIFIFYSSAHRIVGIVSKANIPTAQSLDSWLYDPTVQKILDSISRYTPLDSEWVQSQGIEILRTVLQKVSVFMAAFLAQIPGLLLAVAILILSVYFFLIDGPRFLRFLSGLSPLKRERSHELFNAFEKSCRGVVIGLIASSLVQAFLMALCFKITGLSNAFYIAAVTFVMGMVPVVGSAPIWIGATIYHFATTGIVWAVVMLVGGLVVSTSDNVVRTLVMKGQAEMHPLLALVSVFGAVNLLGATGIFLGPIIAAVFVSFLKIISNESKPPGLSTPADEAIG